MTQEDKDLLLKDLCARLPYKVKVEIKNICKIGTLEEIDLSWAEMSVAVRNENGELNGYDFDLTKPYLFPLSSMTEVQKNIYSIYIDELKRNDGTYFETIFTSLQFWLYANHFDVHGLIPLDLAIDATELGIY